ncbi:MAG: MFS transporter [Myxococcota bacterium]
MLWRFCLYGLLKNQRYFEAFLVLAFAERGLSFTQIGLLVALRELTTNVLEVPSGVMADLFGRRRTMVASFGAYVVAYVVLGLMRPLWATALGMLLIGVGDAFRSGTHKAMIFDWLAAQGREAERVAIYGRTRSWSQVGSAVAVPIAAAVVIGRGQYADVFWLSAIPAVLNLVNLATYPRVLEGPRRADATVQESARALWAAVRALWHSGGGRGLRGLLLEAAAFSGFYRAFKDYLQPLVAGVALATPWLVGLDQAARSAVLVGVVYAGLFVLGSLASRHAHRLVERAGGLPAGARWIRVAVLATFGLMLGGLATGLDTVGIAAFVLLGLLHNLFRPVLVARFDEHAPARLGATVLSVESQATSLGAVLSAPVLGIVVDAVSTSSEVTLWPVAAVGLGLSLLMVTVGGRRSTN